jgi:membrane AbrB-like protein
VTFTLLIGLVGATLAAAAGLPAAALIGSSIAVAGLALARLTTDVPPALRQLAFLLIGCSMGSGVTPEMLDQAARWPLSLLILAVTVVLIMLCCGWLLIRCFDQSLETAALSTSPGALAYALALATGGIGDARTIVVIQSVRLLLITTLLPFILGFLGQPSGPSGAATTAMSGLDLLLVLLPSLVLGLLLTRLRLPAAYLLAGLLISSIAHYLGLVQGRPPASILFFGFAITGTVVGARFSTIPLADLRRLFGASLLVLLLSVAISAGCAVPVARLLDVPYGQVFVAFAPGGVESMAAMAIALHYDPSYVAVHHLFRIFLLMALLPLLFKANQLRHQQNTTRDGSGGA